MDGRLTTETGLDVAFTFDRNQNLKNTSHLSAIHGMKNLIAQEGVSDMERLLK